MAVTVIAAAVAEVAAEEQEDRRGSRMPALLFFLLLTFLGLVLFAVAQSVPLLTVACLLIGAGQGGTSGPLMALLADLTPEDRMGRAVGTNNVFGDIGGGLGPMVSLPLVESVGFWPVYIACAVLPLVAGGILLAGVRRETGEFLPRVGENGTESATSGNASGVDD
jgi:MFS family permease